MPDRSIHQQTLNFEPCNFEHEGNRPVECLGMTFPNDEERQNRTGSVAPPEG